MAKRKVSFKHRCVVEMVFSKPVSELEACQAVNRFLAEAPGVLKLGTRGWPVYLRKIQAKQLSRAMQAERAKWRDAAVQAAQARAKTCP